MPGEVEYGRCDVCGKEGHIQRTYFHYNIQCECHSPNHFEIVFHCKDCVPKEPIETKVLLATSKLERVNRR